MRNTKSYNGEHPCRPWHESSTEMTLDTCPVVMLPTRHLRRSRCVSLDSHGSLRGQAKPKPPKEEQTDQPTNQRMCYDASSPCFSANLRLSVFAEYYLADIFSTSRCKYALISPFLYYFLFTHRMLLDNILA